MKKRTKKELDQIFGFMMEKFPNADTELIYHNGFQLLVAVILSAQTTDKQVNKVTDKLWKQSKNLKISWLLDLRPLKNLLDQLDFIDQKQSIFERQVRF